MIAIYEQRQGLRVVATNKPDLHPGMPLAEATGALHELHDPLADRATLERVAEWCEQFSPIVAIEETTEPNQPECLFFDISGLAEVFHSETTISERICRAFMRRSLEIRLAIADTLGMAWGLAHFGEEISIAPLGDATLFATLPVAALRLPLPMVKTLHELGLQSVGQLLLLPRESLTARFGPQLIERIDQALGDKVELVVPYRAIPEIIVQREFEFPLEQRAAIESVITQLIAEIAAALTARQQGAIQLECQLQSQKQETRLVASLFEASSDPQHLLELLLMRFERITLPGPVDSLRLSVLLSARLICRQQELFAANQNHERELALLIDRLSGRLGRESVVRAVPVADAQPEYAYRYEPLAGQKQKTPVLKKPARKSSTKERAEPAKEERPWPERPLLLEPRPIQLEVLAVAPEGPPMQFRFQGEQHRTRRSWGPERIQTGWWRGKYIRRDYYRVESDRGRQYWLFRTRSGQWFLHGIFD